MNLSFLNFFRVAFSLLMVIIRRIMELFWPGFYLFAIERFFFLLWVHHCFYSEWSLHEWLIDSVFCRQGILVCLPCNCFNFNQVAAAMLSFVFRLVFFLRVFGLIIASCCWDRVFALIIASCRCDQVLPNSKRFGFSEMNKGNVVKKVICVIDEKMSCWYSRQPLKLLTLFRVIHS